MRITRTARTAGLLALLVALSGCSFPDTSREKAEWFFARGSDKIVDSLEDQGLEDAPLQRVKDTLADHRSAVVKDLTAAFSEQRESFRTLYSGQATEAMLSAENTSHEARRQALRSIGAMHADIEEIVGAETWAAANDQRRARFDERFHD